MDAKENAIEKQIEDLREWATAEKQLEDLREWATSEMIKDAVWEPWPRPLKPCLQSEKSRRRGHKDEFQF